MANKSERLHSVTAAYTATASASTSPRIPYGSVGSGVMVVTAVTGAATKIAWHTALENEGAAYPVKSGGSALETTVSADEAHAIPSTLEGAAFLVPVADAGTVTIRLSVKG